MVKKQGVTGIEKATQKPWTEWLTTLEDMGARDLTHKEIARKLYDLLDGTIENHGWWAQGITVAYEQQIGRRVPGQREDGTFEISVSKTCVGTMDELFTAWCTVVSEKADFNGVEIEKQTQSETEKWRNWRCSLADGTKIVVGINQKDSEKVLFSLAHQKLQSLETGEEWKDFWHEFISETIKN